MGRIRRVVAYTAVVGMAVVVATVGTGTAHGAAPGAAQVGSWTAPFAEPTINGKASQQTCIPADDHHHDGADQECKPTAGSMAVLGGPDVAYWDALESMEDVEHSVVLEFGAVSENDQSRVLHLGSKGPTWTTPKPATSGAKGGQDPLVPGAASTEPYNDAALFCAALSFLPDGRVLAVGGTAYYEDPKVTSKYGVTEIQGLATTRVFDPKTGRWSQLGDMHEERWYPTTVPLADGRVFVASGVRRLVKPVYPDQPAASGRNDVTTETFDPKVGQWADNGPTAHKSLPLFPRLALLPNGQIYFNSAGQVFNPMGQAYDEVTWNLAAAYDPATKSWSNVGVPGLGTPAPGFRGSTFSIMLPLTPDDGYTSASFLTAGGVLGTTPGTYFAVKDSRIDTVDTKTMKLSSVSTHSLNQARWYGTGVLTPTGEVIAFSGASADEVDGPGTGIPVTTPELFDPATKTWRELAPAKEKRTYHNTAALLPDGRILVGGHAPIGTLYAFDKTLVDGVTTPQEHRDPTFEIYSPPYLFRGDRPRIVGGPHETYLGQLVPVTLSGPATNDIDYVTLMRRTAITHLVDGGQRAVVLPVERRSGNTLFVRVPSNPNVVPPGPYLLFVNRETKDGRVPSVGWEMDVPTAGQPSSAHAASVAPAAPLTAKPGVDLARAGAVAIDARLAFHEIDDLSPAPHHHDGGGTTPLWPVAAVLGSVALGWITLSARRGTS